MDCIDVLDVCGQGEAAAGGVLRSRPPLTSVGSSLVTPAKALWGVPSSTLPELDVVRVQRWCAQRVPVPVQDQVRVECDVAPRHVTIVERRPPWREDLGPDWTSFPIARLRYTRASGQWTLYWRDRNLRFHLYDLLAPSCSIEHLLQEIERDRTGIFWG